MNAKIVIITLCIAAAIAKDTALYQEAQCVQAGGECRKPYQCSAEPTEEFKALCPLQKDSGVTCCPKGVAMKCGIYGVGECTKDCPPAIHEELFDVDCSAGEFCCIYR